MLRHVNRNISDKTTCCWICAEMLKNKELTRKTIQIFSDSQALVKALDCCRWNSETVWNSRETLCRLGKRSAICNGQNGNEKKRIRPEPFYVDEKTHQYFRNIPSMCHFKAFIICFLNWQKTDKLLECRRAHLKVLVGLLSGECKLKYHKDRKST